MSDKGAAPAPFIKIILPALAGLALSAYFDINHFATGVLCIAALATALAAQRRGAGSAATWLGILLFFFTVSEAATPTSRLPEGQYVTAVAQIREISSVRGRWQHTIADVGYYKPQGAEAAWQKADESIQLSIDTSYAVAPGMQMAFRGWLNPIDTTGSSYGNLMRRRGLHARLYLTPGNMLKEAGYTSATPAYYAYKLHEKAVRRLDRLDLGDDSRAVVAAMVTGDRGTIGRNLRQEYNRSGGAHLLAVSGLHVGIVFILINIVLYLLPAFPRGHIVKNAAAIACIWLYAVTAGLAPSAMRAALMFSFAQLALASSSRRNALNIMLGSAIIMLAVNPNYIADPGFLLSYAAVLSIFVFYRPIFDLVRTGHKLPDAVIGVIVVGFVATVGTAPISSHLFGNFSLIGILINPIVILTAHIIVLLGVVWIIAPAGLLQPLFSAALDTVAGIQNSVIEWSAAQTWAIFEGHLPAAGVFLCYTLIATSAIIVHTTNKYGTHGSRLRGHRGRRRAII